MLKWFRAEQQRIDILAQLTEAQRQQRNKGIQSNNIEKEDDNKEKEQSEKVQVEVKLSSSDQKLVNKRDDLPIASNDEKESEEDRQEENKVTGNPTLMV